jgi:sorting nexin-1/2
VVVAVQVRSKCTLPQYSRQSNEVIRRFRDFDWLSGQLAKAHRGVIIPPLPEKNAVQKFAMSNEFVEDRRRALQVGGRGWGGGHDN